MKKFMGIFLFLYIIYAVNCRPNTAAEDEDDYDVNVAEPETGIQNDNNYEEYSDIDGEDDVEPDLPDANLVTRPQDFIAKENETVQLPCQLENAGPLVTIWKKNNAMIFQDTIKFGIGNNYKFVNRSLVISNVGANETANYTCLIPLTKTQSLQVTHRLFVQTAPKIISLKAQNDITQLDAGKTLVLTCKAIGFPKPTIKWSRKGQRIGSAGETVTIENVSHNHAGEYQCLADNNIEPPAHEFIYIGITHKPVIRIEKIIVNSDNDVNEELVCEVHAVPRADVVWKRDGLNIRTNERIHFKNYNHTYILQIKGVKQEDLGVYTCSAKNRVGKTERNVTLTMKPSPAKYIKARDETERNQLVWEVNSKAPIIQFELQFKRKSDSEWQSVNPEVRNPDGNIYTVGYNLSNLAHLHGGYYEARLRSENNYGWSDWSTESTFKIDRHHHHHNPSILFEPITPAPDVHQKDVYETHPSDNNEAEFPRVTTQAPFDDIPQEPQIQNTEIKQPTQEQPPQQQPAKGELPLAVQETTQAPLEIPQEPQAQNTEIKKQTQEQPPQKQSAKGGNNPDGAATLMPAISLLCIALFSTIYSR